MIALAGATQEEVRRHNLASIARYVHRANSCTRSDLVAVTGLNRSTVGSLTQELIDAGLLRQSGIDQPARIGRPSLAVEAAPTGAVVIAIEYGVSSWSAALVGFGGTLLAEEHGRHKVTPTAEQGVRHMAGIAEAMRAKAPKRARIVGVGVSVPGLVRVTDGMVRRAPNLDWHEVPLGAELAHALRLPVSVGNDADLGAIAELTRGAAGTTRNAIYIAGEFGIGGGVVVDGQLMAGAGGYAGELGHMMVNPQGHECYCGSHGCWETEIGAQALARSLRGVKKSWSPQQIVDAAIAGDKECKAAVNRVAEWIGIGLLNLVNVLNPEIVVLGGVTGVVQHAAPGVVEEHLERSMVANYHHVSLRLPELGQNAVLMGAAESAFASVLVDPLSVAVKRRA